MNSAKKIGEVKTDDKGRLPLTKILKNHLEKLGLNKIQFSDFDVYLSEEGYIILEPQVKIPAKEAWLFQNQSALESVKRGLEQSAKGQIIELDEDFTQDV